MSFKKLVYGLLKILIPKGHQKTRIHNFIFNYPHDGRSIYIYKLKKSFEPIQTRLIQKYCKQGMTFIDIGANAGYYSLLLSKKVGETGRIYAFEPEPNNFSLLLSNVLENRMLNMVMENKAVSNKSGTTKLNISKISHGRHSITETEANQEQIEVKTITIDEYFENRKVDLVKIDVETAEPLVIEGMRKTIKANPNIIVFLEFAYNRMKAAKGIDPDKLLNYLFETFNVHIVNEFKGTIIKTTLKEIYEQLDDCEIITLLCSKKRLSLLSDSKDGVEK